MASAFVAVLAVLQCVQALQGVAYASEAVEMNPHGAMAVQAKPHSFSVASPAAFVRVEQKTEPKPVNGSAPDLLEVFAHNQETRKAIKMWISADTLAGSIDNYGLGPPVASLAKDTGKDPIQHDFISQLGARLEAEGETVRYLEIGVSVLKSIHTQSNFFHNAIVTAADIEDPNPTIENKWEHKNVVDQWEVDAYRGSHKRQHDYINKYSGPNGNTLYYAAGDAYSGVTYDHLRKTIVDTHGPMNLVLSDAYHTADSVTQEVKDLLAYGIIAPGQHFTLVWDDCDDSWDGIYSAMGQIFRTLRHEFAGQSTCSGRFTIPGWVGQNEGAHRTCVFSTMDLSGASLQASKTWVAAESDVTCVSGAYGKVDGVVIQLVRFRLPIIFCLAVSIVAWFGWIGVARVWLKSRK